MATPVINDIAVVYPQTRGHKYPGEAAELFVAAFDSDNVTITAEITVADGQGNVTKRTALVLQNDPLTNSGAIIDPATGFTITQDPSQPNRFVVV